MRKSSGDSFDPTQKKQSLFVSRSSTRIALSDSTSGTAHDDEDDGKVSCLPPCLPACLLVGLFDWATRATTTTTTMLFFWPRDLEWPTMDHHHQQQQ